MSPRKTMATPLPHTESSRTATGEPTAHFWSSETRVSLCASGFKNRQCVKKSPACLGQSSSDWGWMQTSDCSRIVRKICAHESRHVIGSISVATLNVRAKRSVWSLDLRAANLTNTWSLLISSKVWRLSRYCMIGRCPEALTTSTTLGLWIFREFNISEWNFRKH